MKGLLFAALLLLTWPAHAAEMRVGTLLVPWPDLCKSTIEPRTIKVECPDGERVLISPFLAQADVTASVAEAHSQARAEDVSQRIMAPAAAQCGEVLSGVKRVTANNTLIYSTASRCTRKRKEYYFLQYVVAGAGGMIFFTVEGFGKTADQAARFDALFQGARFEQPEAISPNAEAPAQATPPSGTD